MKTLAFSACVISGLLVAANAQAATDCFYDIALWPGKHAPIRRDMQLSMDSLSGYGLQISESYDSGEVRARFRVPTSKAEEQRGGELRLTVYPTVAEAHEGIVSIWDSSTSSFRGPRLSALEFPAADVAFGRVQRDYSK